MGPSCKCRGCAVAFKEGYAAGLDAAREAVKGIEDSLYTHYRIACEPPGKVDWSQHRYCEPINDVLAAIDALREKP